MTREITVTLDKNDFVQDVTTAGSRWRFQRIRRFNQNSKRRLSEEDEQAICAMYVDRPNLSAKKIAESFGIVSSTVSGVVEAYGIAFRRPNPRKAQAEKFTLGYVRPQAQESAPETQKRHGVTDPREYGVNGTPWTLLPEPQEDDTRPVWRVTVTRTVVEEVHADTLLDIAAIYDGTDARVTKVERA